MKLTMVSIIYYVNGNRLLQVLSVINSNLFVVMFISDLFAEDLFEVTSCYFPIDFTPVSNAVNPF